MDGTVDGMKFDKENVLTTDLDQEVRGPVTINEPTTTPLSSALVKAPAGVEFKGTVNNVNVQEGISNLVRIKKLNVECLNIVIKFLTF